jgi:hypothetical protein
MDRIKKENQSFFFILFILSILLIPSFLSN